MADESTATPLATPLHDWHKARGGRIVPFAGWAMPVQYTTIVDEHRAVRERAGLFDIGHMGRLRFEGPGALDWLERSTTNQVAKLAEGQIQYSLLANEAGGLIDDILVYRSHGTGYSVVCNASNRPAVVAQFEALKGGADATMTDLTLATAMIAVQGPRAVGVAEAVFDRPLADLKYYHHRDGTVLGAPASASRTGYTGEDGFELIVAADRAVATWEALLAAGADAGILPCGLGARDTLRLEAAMPLYGHEMDEATNPYAAGLAWAVKLAKGEFHGRDALRRFKANPGGARIGLALGGKRIARQGAVVLVDGEPDGAVTSGTYSPTLGRSIAMALVRPEAPPPGAAIAVDVRGQVEPAEVVPLPFYRRPS